MRIQYTMWYKEDNFLSDESSPQYDLLHCFVVKNSLQLLNEKRKPAKSIRERRGGRNTEILTESLYRWRYLIKLRLYYYFIFNMSSSCSALGSL